MLAATSTPMPSDQPPKLTADALGEMKRPQLQMLCKQYGCKASGKNAELIARLLEAALPAINDNVDVAVESVPTVAEDTAVQDYIAHGNDSHTTDIDGDCNERRLSALAITDDTALGRDIPLNIDGRRRSQTIKADVWREIEQRARADSVNLPQSPARALGRSKSVSVRGDKVSADCLDRLATAHSREFSRMDSILKHYAAKRAMKTQAVSMPDTLATKTIRTSKSAVNLKKAAAQVESAHSVEPSVPITTADIVYSKPGFFRKFLNSAKKAKAPVAKENDTKPIPFPIATSAVVKKPSTASISSVRRVDGSKATVKATTVPSIRPESRGSIHSVKSSKSSKFDLKASLARPLSYKPYTGPIREQYVAPVNSAGAAPPVSSAPAPEKVGRRKSLVSKLRGKLSMASAGAL